MALGMEVGLGPVHIVLDGDTAPLPKRGQGPNFRPIFIATYLRNYISATDVRDDYISNL